MKLILHTQTTIDSAHRLDKYKGKCYNLHGHTWLINLWFEGDSKYLNDVGILVDFGIVKQIKIRLDHGFLNELINVNPTAENICMWIFHFVRRQINNDHIKIRVRVYENCVLKNSYCECGSK